MPMENHACKNNKCSHICLLGPNRAATCACPENMELLNGFLCQISKKTETIVLAIGQHIAAVEHQTFGRHTASDAQEVKGLADIIEFNSLNGQIFVAESQLGRIIAVDMKNKLETPIVNQHVLNVKAMAFGEL
jgi:hypothetical protein